MKARELLQLGPVMPVLVIEDAALAVPLARALVDGGLYALEVTLRTPAALAAIRAIAAEVPDAVVGAGTLLTPADVASAREAGARFGVSPGATAELLAAGRLEGWPFLPGVMTPSDILAARSAGYDTLKFFPAEAAGGCAMLKSFRGPFPEVQFCPTGGIDPARAVEYLALPNVGCVGGSWLAPADRTAARDWDAIRQLAAGASKLRQSKE
ncbi:bifunctional 4-hydroxy-2-oxoglutarate aldolase/2-dehydro-3-deoxy-phosphogluconate aldolase [Solimonas sp. K1W22B-7]|uniref:bifunctional 4-hydroxy-2-oxoglutarate aldolase/2-dehydro-3-deoxy-phosphogluconate aldolase n=1 Tax=Solimonas sp. K1W22B-7 TaxID=2303331 RepID=UPI000E333F5D|nr:bifunctional 4-hydroxy-2-oxoglutarate aldolase/2-dehydro-3-deoxy-phosphogluconate aldolase [Solimonas sp. K1W22B-7]AXQ29396.1 bifunctional 4-hydroxy-2-oxoglutarate aldolase/2-dehydro-3-deoxy-phosphogluconate aldolase [Solimonas sp. K1W22B-7]